MRQGGSLRRFPTPEEHKYTPLTRSRSSVEIQKYAEDEDEDPEDFLGNDVVLPLNDSDSGSERSTLMMLNSKLSSNSWLGDEEDEDDPFAQLEEGFDEMDLETNVARDRHARLCKLVEDLVGALKTSQPDDVLADLSEQLVSAFSVTSQSSANKFLDASACRITRAQEHNHQLSRYASDFGNP
jgi:hypothetical protein